MRKVLHMFKPLRGVGGRLLAVLVVLSAPGVAVAQDAPRGYVQGLRGAARTAQTDTAYAGLGAWRINGGFHILSEVGRMRNAIGPELSRRLDAVRASNP